MRDWNDAGIGMTRGTGTLAVCVQLFLQAGGMALLVALKSVALERWQQFCVGSSVQAAEDVPFAAL